MNRRVFLSAVTGGLLAAPLAAGCQQAGMMGAPPPPPTDPRAQVLAYLKSLKAKPSQHFVMGQFTAWQSTTDDEIPPLLALDGGVTPGIIGDCWGEVGLYHAEDVSHWAIPGWSTAMDNSIIGLTAYWNAGSLIAITYLPGMPALVNFNDPILWGRFDTITTNTNDHPIPVTSLLNGTLSCSQWRRGVLYTGLTYNQLLDYHAAYLQRLWDTGVVVIYRPFPEFDANLKRPFNPAYGQYIEWDRTLSAGDFIALWRHVHTYLTTNKGLNNLIWQWSLLDGYSVGAGRNGMSYYPGDDYVDVVGWDDYCDGSDLTTRPTYTALLRQKPTKPMMLGELGLNLAGQPRDFNAYANQLQSTMPALVGGVCWADITSLWKNSNLAAAMANTWLQNAPVPLRRRSTRPVAPVSRRDA